MANDGYRERVEALDPVAYWRLDDASGTTAAAALGGLDGAYRNGVTLAAAGVAGGGSAARFDGQDDHLVVAHAAALALDRGTLSFWFQADDLIGQQGLLSKDSFGYDTGGHVGVWLAGGQLVYRLQDTAATHELRSAAGLFGAGDAVHVAASFGDQGMRLFVNGQLVASGGYAGGLTGNFEPLVLGALSWRSNDLSADPTETYFDGALDEVDLRPRAQRRRDRDAGRRERA